MTTNVVTLADFRPDPGQDLATLIADAIAAGKITIVLGDLGASPGDPQRSAAGALPARADRVLATVLFTDIVGSTERAADLGDAAWRQLLARHDELVRSELERHRGQEVKQTGDGFLATFDGPARAIRCAETIIESVQALGLEVRAGLHSGECEIRNGDVGGMAVHIGSRICALAQPSEVLVSSTVEDLVVGSGIHFEDRGTHELKGVPGSRHLRAVAGEAERAGLTTPLPADERRRTVIDRLALRTIRAARRLSRRTARRVLRD